MTVVIHSSLPAWPDQVKLDGRFKLLWVLRDEHGDSRVASFETSVKRAKHRGYPPYDRIQVEPPIFASGMRDGKVEGMPRVFAFNKDRNVCLVLHPIKEQ